MYKAACVASQRCFCRLRSALVSSGAGVVRLPLWQEVWQADCDKLRKHHLQQSFAADGTECQGG